MCNLKFCLPKQDMEQGKYVDSRCDGDELNKYIDVIVS
jgi:hypothetical protein